MGTYTLGAMVKTLLKEDCPNIKQFIKIVLDPTLEPNLTEEGLSFMTRVFISDLFKECFDTGTTRYTISEQVRRTIVANTTHMLSKFVEPKDILSEPNIYLERTTHA